MALHRTGVIRDPTTIQFLFEISETLHDSIDVSEVNNDQQRAHLISTFVQMVSEALNQKSDA